MILLPWNLVCSGRAGRNRLIQFLSKYCAEWIISRADVQGESRCETRIGGGSRLAKVTGPSVTKPLRGS
jgi:hypothetical protein